MSFYTNYVKRGYFTNSGDFKVQANAYKPGGGSWSVSSDERLKKDVRRLEGSLEKLMSLRGTSFEYIDPEASHELAGTRMGLIAQDVEKVFPDWVSTRENGFKMLTVRGFEAVTIEALRDLRAEKDAQIAELKARNVKLLARLEKLEELAGIAADSENK